MAKVIRSMPGWARALFVCNLAFASVFLMGLVADHNLASHIRTRDTVVFPVQSSSAAADTAVGIRGIIMSVETDPSGPTSFENPVWTSSIGALPYPSRLSIKMQDGGTAETLTCTSVTLRGYNSLGVSVSETVTSITESESLTTHSYEDVTYIKGVGCNGASGGTNHFVVRATDHVALRQKIIANTDILSVCVTKEVSGVMGNVRCLPGSRYTINVKANSIDLNVGTAVTGDISSIAMTVVDGEQTVITTKGTTR